jgi:hypothetical protein
MLTRRSLIGSLIGALVCAPSVVHSGVLMPISSLKLPKLKYIRALGPDAGMIETFAGTPPTGMIPMDGRLVYGFDYPDLFKAVRGRTPSNPDDDYIHIWAEPEHTFNPSPSADYYHSMVGAGLPEKI